jgi:hypothetical protein
MDLLAAETLFDSYKEAIQQSLDCRLSQTVAGQVRATTVEEADSRNCGPPIGTFTYLNSVHLSVQANGAGKPQYMASLLIIVRVPALPPEQPGTQTTASAPPGLPPAPTALPTPSPTTAPVSVPTVAPTPRPTAIPTPAQTVEPAPTPTVAPTPMAVVTAPPSAAATPAPRGTPTSAPAKPAADRGLRDDVLEFLRDASADIRIFEGPLQTVGSGQRYLGKRTVARLTDCSYEAATTGETFVNYVCDSAPMDLLAAETLFDSYKDAIRESLHCRLSQTVTGQVQAATVEEADSRNCGPPIGTFTNLNSVHLLVRAARGGVKPQYATSLSIIVRIPT